MKPDQLQPENFRDYSPVARAFTVQNLALLRRLPLSICPSFLVQISDLDTCFPRERILLQNQCAALEAMQPGELDSLLAPIRAITLPPDISAMNWVKAPELFVERLSEVLWSSGQINAFHQASRTLFAAIPDPADGKERLLLIALGRGADLSRRSLLKKLARRGLRLEALQTNTAAQQMIGVLRQRSERTKEDYGHWYIDGGEKWMAPAQQGKSSLIETSYTELAPLRDHLLQRMQDILQQKKSGAELMRSALASTGPSALDSDKLSSDPVLQRFYTELFTKGSGTQVFSTSFVQWSGRELTRRAKPSTLLLRYAPRQRYRSLNEMIEKPLADALDPESSLIDGEMGAFYNWIEMNWISAPGKLTTLVWAEGSQRAVLIGPGTQPNTISHQRVTVLEALAFAQGS